jgi:hypothetical protein
MPCIAVNAKRINREACNMERRVENSSLSQYSRIGRNLEKQLRKHHVCIRNSSSVIPKGAVDTEFRR